jgi:hypothetical protein
MAAASSNYLECAELLLSSGASVELKDIFGQSSIDKAHEKGHVDMVNMLERHSKIQSQFNGFPGVHMRITLITSPTHPPPIANLSFPPSPSAPINRETVYLPGVHVRISKEK